MGFLDKALDIAAPGTGSLIEGATEGLDILLGRYGEDAYREAARIQTELLNQGIDAVTAADEAARIALGDASGQASQLLQTATSDAAKALGTSQTDAINQLMAGIQGAEGALGEGGRLLNDAAAGFDPYASAGQQGLQGLLNSVQPGGMARRYEEAARASDPLRRERLSTLQDSQAAAGLSRSGAALDQLANLDQQSIMEQEQLRAMRESGLAQQGLGAQTNISNLAQGGANIQSQIAQLLASGGQTAAGMTQKGGMNLANLLYGSGSAQAGIQQGLGSSLANLSTNYGANIADLLSSIGAAQAQGQVGGAGSRAQGVQNLIDIGTSFI